MEEEGLEVEATATSTATPISTRTPKPTSTSHDVENDSRTMTTRCQSCHTYVSNPFLMVELWFCLIFGVIGHFVPNFIIQLHKRRVPYQLLSSGDDVDVILNGYLNNPYLGKETISNLALVVISFLCPIIVVVVGGVWRFGIHDLHSALCTIFFAMGSTEIITVSLKLYVGYFRPSLYGYCDFDVNSLQCNNDMSDVIKSFPSGHASMSFCGMTFLCLWFFGKAGLHQTQPSEDESNATTIPTDTTTIAIATTNASLAAKRIAHQFKKRVCSILSVLPIFLAIFTASSRVRDNLHHPADIVGGAVIGMICALFSHGLWYNSVFSLSAGQPLLAPLEG